MIFRDKASALMAIQLNKAMTAPEEFVVRMEYTDKEGNRSRRVVSPIRFIGDDSFLALCLCRETPRRFYMNQCANLEVISANDVVMPVPIEELGESDSFEISQAIAPEV